MSAKGRGGKRGARGRKTAAMRRYGFWRDIISKEDRESIDASLSARKTLLEHGYESMAKRIEKMLRQEFPSIPDEAFDSDESESHS